MRGERCRVIDGGATVHLRLTGEFGRPDVPDLDRTASEYLHGACEELVVDLCGASAVDTSTAAWLLRCERWAQQRRARVTVLTAPGAVRDLLEDAGVSGRVAVLDAA